MRNGIAFSTIYMKNTTMRSFMKILTTGMKQKDCAGLPEKKIRIRYFNEWTNNYDHGFFFFFFVQDQKGGAFVGVASCMSVSWDFIEGY